MNIFPSLCEPPPPPPSPPSPLREHTTGVAEEGDRDRPRVSDRSNIFVNPFRGKKENLKDIEDKHALAAMWPGFSALSNRESLSKSDAAFAARVASAAAQVASAAAAAAAAEAAAAAAAASAYAAIAADSTYAAIAARPRSEELKLETKGSLDYMLEDDHENWNLPSPAQIPINPERHLKLWAEMARKALEYYKDTQGEEFELVELKDYEPAILFPYTSYHITFLAKRKDISDPELFFAELYERFNRLDKFEFKICMILDPCGQDVRKGCGYVKGKKDMLHPNGVEFFAGPPGGTPEWV